jgi:hypothetical protein
VGVRQKALKPLFHHIFVLAIFLFIFYFLCFSPSSFSPFFTFRPLSFLLVVCARASQALVQVGLVNVFLSPCPTCMQVSPLFSIITSSAKVTGQQYTSSDLELDLCRPALFMPPRPCPFSVLGTGARVSCHTHHLALHHPSSRCLARRPISAQSTHCPPHCLTLPHHLHHLTPNPQQPSIQNGSYQANCP